jgi:protein-S-isoprenylcysteine O-methyltransferase Ste14
MQAPHDRLCEMDEKEETALEQAKETQQAQSRESIFIREPDSPRLQRLVTSAGFDKLTALLLVIWVTYSSVSAIQKNLGLTLNILFASTVILNLLVLVRHQPQRVSLNPWFWLLTLVASTHVAWYGVFMDNSGSIQLTPDWVSYAIATFGMGMTVWGRVALGLNFSFVPALRKIVNTGPFRYVRHPVYTGLVLLLVARFTESASVTTLILTVTGMILWALKGASEEVFLSRDDAYREYMQHTRWRLIPFVF